MWRRCRCILFLACVFFIIQENFGQQSNKLRFDNNDRFKIVQFSDIHWGDKHADNIPWADVKKSNPKQTFENLEYLIEFEKPDLIVLTGDIVTSPPVRKGWDTIGFFLDNKKIPWTVALGNHDGLDAGLSRNEVVEILNKFKFFTGNKETEITGASNFHIPIYDEFEDTVKSVIYILDSNNRPKKEEFGAWDWIHYDQINWYNKTSQFYTKNNGNKPVNSLMFFHIPLREHGEVEKEPSTFLGSATGGRIGAADINSGLFASLIDNQDVMGVFVGHAHNIDNMGMYKGIGLGFGRVSGAEASSSLERGARVLQMVKDKRYFETWTRTQMTEQPTVYFYPSGISTKDEEELQLHQASKKKNQELEQGLKYRYYEGGRFKKTDDILKNGKLVKSGVVGNFNLDRAERNDSIGFVFEGMIKVPKKDVYRFYTNSDDGSILYINDQLVVDNDGSHYQKREEGKVFLEAGFHKIKVEYFQDYLGKKIEVGWIGRSVLEGLIPDSTLFFSNNSKKKN